jgi:hypothetical protein
VQDGATHDEIGRGGATHRVEVLQGTGAELEVRTLVRTRAGEQRARNQSSSERWCVDCDE